MEVIGHRACGELYPENTVHAVEQSSQHLTTIEIDVRRARSGELVVFHDERVDRLTDATGKVTDLTWNELRTLEVLDSGESIPLLSEMLDAFPPNVTAQVELKQAGMAADVCELATAVGNDVYVSSFVPEALAEVRDLDWDVPTGYLFNGAVEEELERAAELDCDAVHPDATQCVETDVIDQAHNRGFDVIAWGVEESSELADSLRAVGVDGFTADRWDIV